ncbi:putative butyrate kinase [Sporomusaceae bacterium FL31]|nr:putative butyrate kinase [Sporomusaceae bacterium FL31]GCE35522.1 putative butyrate kinase [Sporomusaceae bacterium]
MSKKIANELILVINPGATSTKFAVFNGETQLLKKTIQHSVSDLQNFIQIFDQYHYRLELILTSLREEGVALDSLKAVVGRGGILKPLSGGTYQINTQMVADLKLAERGEHASNLGAVMAFDIAEKLKIASYIVDPVSVDEMTAVARFSGMPELPRISLSHALNMKAVARKAAQQLGRRYEEVHFIVVHLGTGISVSPHKNGLMIDVNNAMEEGPFSPDRSGGLPASQLVRLCYSGQYSYQELKRKINGQGGVYAYLGTRDMREVEALADQGNKLAAETLEAFCYQVAKEIGAMATVLEGQVDRIILTGGMAFSGKIVAQISKRVQFIAPILVIPGEEELESLALGALRVLRGEEEVRNYQ